MGVTRIMRASHVNKMLRLSAGSTNVTARPLLSTYVLPVGCLARPNYGFSIVWGLCGRETKPKRRNNDVPEVQEGILEDDEPEGMTLTKKCNKAHDLR